MEKIKKIEIDIKKYPVCCPFCEQVIMPDVNGSKDEVAYAVCKHTLFIACSDGFDYRSESFNANMNLPQNEDDLHLTDYVKDCDYDAFTDNVTIPGAVKFVAYEDSFHGPDVFYGFAPGENE